MPPNGRYCYKAVLFIRLRDGCNLMRIGDTWAIPALLACVAALLCLPGYFQADDFGLLAWLRYDRPSPLHWFDVWEMGIWRPFHLAVFWVETRLFGSNPLGYRLARGVLSLATVVVFYHLAQRLFRSPRAALTAASLFACTYSHWEAVFWICASSELWVGFLGAVMGLGVLRAEGAAARRWGSVAVLAHILALLAKENAVAWLPIVAGMVLHQRYAGPRVFPPPALLSGGEEIAKEHKRTRRAAAVRPAARMGQTGLWLALGIPWVLALVGRGYLASGGAAVQSGLFSLWGTHVWHNAGAYLIRLFFPWIPHPPSAWAYGALAAAVGFCIYAILAKLYRLWLPLGWMFVALIPYLGIDTPGYYPSRYTYLAGMGGALLMGELIEPLWNFSGRIKAAGIAVVTGYCLLNLSLYAIHPEIRYFQKDDALYRQVVDGLRKLNLPPVPSVAVAGLDLPLEEKIPNSIRYLYALAYPPPERVWSGEGPWPGTPALILRWENGVFLVMPTSKPGGGR